MIIFRDLDTGKKGFSIIDEPKITYYITKDEIALETEQGRSSPDEALFDIVSIFFGI